MNRRIRSVAALVPAVLLAAQPVLACCGGEVAMPDPGDATIAAAYSASDDAARTAGSERHGDTMRRAHCADPEPEPASTGHRCRCGDSCASLDAAFQNTDAVAPPGVAEPQPVATVPATLSQVPSTARVAAPGLPPPATAPPPRQTLVSLKRLLRL